MTVDIFKLMSEGENQNVEFLDQKVSPLTFAKVISAFGNTDGGTILFGVRDSYNIDGVDSNTAKVKIEKALGMLSSSDFVSYEIQQVRMVKNVAVITIEKSAHLVFCDSGAYMRSGKNIRVMLQQEIVSLIGSPNGNIESLSGTLEKQTRLIESLKEEVTKGSSWESKIKDHFIGGVIGALVGLAFGVIGF